MRLPLHRRLKGLMSVATMMIPCCQAFAEVETSPSSFLFASRTPRTILQLKQSVPPSLSTRLFMTATSSNNKRSTSSSSHESQETNVDKNRVYKRIGSIIKDEKGTIDRHFAEQLYHWEQENRQRNNLEPLNFSMRSGLRWVHETALKHVQWSNRRKHKNARLTYNDLYMGRRVDEHVSTDEATDSERLSSLMSTDLYCELVQEGLAALLDAMATYDAKTLPNVSWPDFAQKRIHKAVTKSLDERQHLIQIPPSVRKVIVAARKVYRALVQKQRQQLASPLDKPPPVTLTMVAKRLHMTPNELRDHVKWYKQYANTHVSNLISLDSTVEISQPQMDSDIYMDRSEWERRQGYHSRLNDVNQFPRFEDGEVDDASDIIDYFQEEVDDDAWVQELEQVVGLLQDVIPDQKEPREPLWEENEVLADMIRGNLGSFLQSNLEPDELTIVQMTFGLEGRQPASFRQMATALKLQGKDEAMKLLERALTKLRRVFRERYLEQDESDDDLSTESV